MYLPTTTPLPVGTHKWRLVHKQTLNDDMLRFGYNGREYVFTGKVKILDKYINRHLKFSLISICNNIFFT